MKKLNLILNILRTKWRELVEAQPRVKEDQVSSIVNILRRDFDVVIQNEIVLEVIQELTELRDKDILKKSEELTTLKEQTELLRTKI